MPGPIIEVTDANFTAELWTNSGGVAVRADTDTIEDLDVSSKPVGTIVSITALPTPIIPTR